MVDSFIFTGPISLALYLSDAEAEEFQHFVLESDYLRSRTNVGYHIIYKQGVSTNFFMFLNYCMLILSLFFKYLYPINLLRNVALDQVRTPFVFLSDIDFLPMPNLHSVLKKAIDVLKLESENKVNY